MKKMYLLLLSALLAVGGGVTAQAQSEEDPEAISTRPEGTWHSRDFRNGISIATSRYYGMSARTYSNGVGQYVEGTDGSLYLLDPVKAYGTGTWIKLDKVSDGRYVAKFPQVLYVNSQGGVDYITRLVVKNGSTSSNVTYVADSTNVADGQNEYFSLKDGVLTMDDSLRAPGLRNYPQAIMGVVSEDLTWKGHGEGALKITPNNLTNVALPAGVKTVDYNLAYSVFDSFSGTSSEQQGIVKVAIDGNDVYVNNPYTNDSTSWIKGTISGNRATFKQQYIGPDYKDGYQMWFKPGYYETIADSSLVQYGWPVQYSRGYAILDEVSLNYDADAKSLKAQPGASFMIGIDSLSTSLQLLANYDSIQLTPFNEVAATPADPVITYFSEYTNGYGYLALQIPTVDVNGVGLNTNELYYRMYVDDAKNPYVFSKDLYTHIPGDEMVNIPYNYDDETDIASQNGYRVIYYYFDSSVVDSIGIQSVYYGAGEEHTSNIVWQYTAHHAATGINSINGESAGVKSVAYYDLSGRRVAEPKQAGIYIKETTLADGTKKGVKFIKK